jgi:hypothetical protein
MIGAVSLVSEVFVTTPGPATVRLRICHSGLVPDDHVDRRDT